MALVSGNGADAAVSNSCQGPTMTTNPNRDAIRNDEPTETEPCFKGTETVGIL